MTKVNCHFELERSKAEESNNPCHSELCFSKVKNLKDKIVDLINPYKNV
ncbi:hypothetical protein [Helicobacter sp. MIT 14-3879]|nr:hypothetical protein [Helicobacter sp. MIT 14-3879]